MWTRLSRRKGVPTHTVKINFSLQAHCNSKELQSVHVHLYIHVHVHCTYPVPRQPSWAGQLWAVPGSRAFLAESDLCCMCSAV